MTKKPLYLLPMALLGIALFIEKKFKAKKIVKKVIKDSPKQMKERAIERWQDDGGHTLRS
jgi:hypothetical protein